MGDLIWLKYDVYKAWSTKAKPPWTINVHLKKMKGRKVKQVFSTEVGTSAGNGVGCAQRKGGWGCIWWIYFVAIYESRRMKPVEIILRRERGWGRMKREQSN
jgi:hypothetical protein